MRLPEHISTLSYPRRLAYNLLRIPVDAQGFPDLLLYDMVLGSGTMILRDGSLLAGWKYRGPAMESRAHDEMAWLSTQVARVLKLGSGWMMHGEAIRSSTEDYPAGGAFPDPVTRLIDEERRQQFLAEGAHFETEYFVAVTYHPPAEAEEVAKAWLFTGGEPDGGGSAQRVLAHFEEKVAEIQSNLESSLEEVRRLQYDPETGFDDLLRFVHTCVTDLDHPMVLPSPAVDLRHIVGSVDLVAGLKPQVDGKHLRVIAITGFPRYSVPGILHALDTLAIEYRWSQRGILLDTEEAKRKISTKMQIWASQVIGFIDKFFDKSDVNKVDVDAKRMEIDAGGSIEHNEDGALGEASSGLLQFLYYTAVVIVRDEDLGKLDAKVKAVTKVIRAKGFACRVETFNAVEALLGSFPGDGYRNLRQYMIHTLNWADLLPLSGVWTGARECPSRLMPPHSPPLLYGSTTGSAPFRFHMHVEDVGHQLWCGPTGSGKSTLAALTVAQWFRFPNGRVYVFDKGYSMYALTQAVGGEFYDPGLSGVGSVVLQPLANLDDDDDIAWAKLWLENLAVMEGCTVGPKERGLISEAISVLRSSPQRTLTELWTNVQDENLKAALEPYTVGSSLGDLLDGDRDAVAANSRMVTFEIGTLMEMGERAKGAVLPYLFHRIAREIQRGTGEPVLILIDEGQVALESELFRKTLREWLNTLRKHNAAVVLITPNISDVFNYSISDVIMQSCKTKVFFPSAEARTPDIADYYRRFGLGEREIEQIYNAQPKRDAYVLTPEGRGMMSVAVGPVGLSFCGANAKSEQKQIAELVAKFGDFWPAEWLRIRGVNWCNRLAVEIEDDKIAMDARWDTWSIRLNQRMKEVSHS